MISSKIIQAYLKELQNINEAFQKEIDSFDIDFEKPVQYFYMFIDKHKYKAGVVKHTDCYNYNLKIFNDTDDVIYSAVFKFDEYTGKSKIYKVHKPLEIQ